MRFAEASKFFALVRDAWKTGFLLLLGANLFIKAAGSGSQALAAIFLSPSELGAVRLLHAYLLPAFILAGLGYGDVLLKLCSEKRPEGEKKWLFLRAFRSSLGVTTCVWFLLLGLSLAGWVSADERVRFWLPIFSLALFPLIISNLQVFYSQALRRFLEAARLELIGKGAGIPLLVFACWYWGFNGYVSVFMLTVLLAALLLWHRQWRRDSNVESIEAPESWIVLKKMSRFTLVAGFLNALALQADLFIADHMVQNSADLGQYAFALLTISVLLLFTLTLRQMAVPNLARRSENAVAYRAFYSKNQMRQSVLAIVMVVGGILILPPFVESFLGGTYTRAAGFLPVLAGAWGFRHLYTMKSASLLASGKMGWFLACVTIALVPTVVLIWLLTQRFGLEGTALGYLGGEMMRYATFSFFSARLMTGLTQQACEDHAA